MKSLLLIDANSLIHRAYHALPPLTSKDGTPAGALYGLARMLGKMLKEEPSDYIAACFDRPEPTFRKEKFKEYKAQRPETDKELVSQLIAAHDLFAALGIKTFDQPGFEADDCIASLASAFEDEKDLRIVILTGDRDTLQLVRGDRVVVRAPRKGISDTLTYDEEKIREDYGLEPRQIIDYKALAGDASDNIKGVPGVGPKTATALISKYGSVEAILDNPDDPATSKVVQNKEAALTSKSLVILRSDVPLGRISLEDLSIKEDIDAKEKYFQDLGFKSLYSAKGNREEDSESKSGSSQGSMF